jgi:PAS domain S-box-containing protein
VARRTRKGSPRPEAPRPARARGGAARIAELEARLREAEETLRSIRGGDVDAIVVYGPQGKRIFTLRGAEHSYRVLVEAMREGAATVAADGTLLYCNRSFAEMLGLPLERVIGSPLSAHVPPSHAAKVAVLLERARASDAGARDEAALRGPGGAVVPVLLSANEMHVEREDLLCLVAADLSEVGRLQDALRARDEFLSIASHELKTPLTALLLQIEGLLRLGAAAEPHVVQGRLEAARRQSRRLAQLVNDLLDVSRLRAGRLDLTLDDVDLSAVVAEVVERHRREALAAGCAVDVAAAGPVRGRWDRSRLDQVATNLLSNAMKYGKGRPIRIDVAREAGLARLAVADHGIGIDAADHARIFERFERAAPERQYGGMGLGLWISREILARMGGTIRVESRLGEGARFVVELPACAAEEPAAGSAA